MSIPNTDSFLLGLYPQGNLKIPNFGPKFGPVNREYIENGRS